MELLKEIDPFEDRFLQTTISVPYSEFIRTQTETNSDIKECMKKGFQFDETSTVLFMRKLVPLDTQKMTKEQYRYLRDSITILQQNHILHGDLPGNVMMDPIKNNLPIIIDWENAIFYPDPIVKNLDMIAFSQSGLFVKKI